MLPEADLPAALGRVLGASYAGVLFRAVHLEALYGFHRAPPYPHPQPLYSLGAPARGARFTPRGGPASLYLAEDTETALAEANQVNLAIRHQNLSAAPLIEPTVTLAVTVHLLSVLDLGDDAVRSVVATDVAELTGSWRLPPPAALPPTQALGAALFATGRSRPRSLRCSEELRTLRSLLNRARQSGDLWRDHRSLLIIVSAPT